MVKKQKQRDYVFLQEMLQRFDKGRNGDTTEYDMVHQMIVDWIDELETQHKLVYCNVCKKEPCKCLEIQTYAMSVYPGEFHLVPCHPNDTTRDLWYKKTDVDKLLDGSKGGNKDD